MPDDEATPRGATANGPVQPCPLQKAWIAIELVGDDDRPIANERYVIVLPDGTERRGKTDARGVARIEGILGGSCDVCFPDLDRDAQEFIESVTAPDRA